MFASKSRANGVLLATISAGLLTALALTTQARDSGSDSSKPGVLSIGGSVTEIVYALGQGDRLVARDTTSTYPPEAEDLPDVGYMRALSPEGVLSVSPELILSEDGAGPPETMAVLTSSGVDIVTIPNVESGPGIAEKIKRVGDALGVSKEAEALAANVEAEIATAKARADRLAGDSPKRVLFVLSMQGGRVMASGTGTAASAIIELAGGVNAVTEFEGYKPMTDEAVSVAAPDVILMMDRGGDHAIANEVLFGMPAFQPTPAAETGAIVRMDGLYLLGFGPRTAKAVSDLSHHLYGG